MSYIPKHAKPVSSREGKDGAHHTPGLTGTSAGRHSAPSGKPRQAPRAKAPRRKIAA
jgi:hypothetical protein